LQMYLKKKGYGVITAANGQQAMELVSTTHLDLILLDIEMPGMDGFHVCEKIRKERNIPIIFLSVKRDVLDKVKCFELGGDDYITKPFNYTELEARIKANLRRYQINKQDGFANIIQYKNLKINLNNNACFIGDDVVELSTKEFQLLALLARYPNRI